MSQASWAPTCDLAALHARAALYTQIREFFARRGVLEVDVPVVGAATVTDPHLASLGVAVLVPGQRTIQPFYLQTSPEFPMKRLLATGCGSIYSLAKVFRDGERSARHNPEFTMLEWYRPGFSLAQLIDEVTQLILAVLGCTGPVIRTYQEVFLQHLGIDPFRIEFNALVELAQQRCAYVSRGDESRELFLDLLLSHCIEPQLGQHGPEFVRDYPAAQAALAKRYKDAQGNEVAARFELYVNGLELANGYDELCDAQELRERFNSDNHQRAKRGLPQIPVDENLLAAMRAGLPACSGVALGVDRLLMLQLGARSIDQVLSFPIERV